MRVVQPRRSARSRGDVNEARSSRARTLASMARSRPRRSTAWSTWRTRSQQRPGEGGFDGQRDEEWDGPRLDEERPKKTIRIEQVEHGGGPAGQAEQRHDAEGEGEPARPARRQQRRGGSPRRHRVEIDADRHVGPEQGQVFAQVEQRPQFGDRLLTFADFLGRRRGEQPARQGFLAGARAGGTQKLEQRTGSEEVEVGGVGVLFVEETGARPAAALPGAVEPGQAVAVVCRRPPGHPPVARDLLMEEQQHPENADRRQQPPGGEEVHSEGRIDHAEAEEEDDDAAVADEPFAPRQPGGANAAVL